MARIEGVNLPKNKRVEIGLTYLFGIGLKRSQDILKSTNGIIIYQEQIIKIANLFAGYTLGEADVLRRAVSKKQQDVLVKERSNFVKKALLQGHSETSSNQIYDYIVKFSNYGFNRAHSVAYGMVSYWMAYLKANYP